MKLTTNSAVGCSKCSSQGSSQCQNRACTCQGPGPGRVTMGRPPSFGGGQAALPSRSSRRRGPARSRSWRGRDRAWRPSGRPGSGASRSGRRDARRPDLAHGQGPSSSSSLWPAGLPFGQRECTHYGQVRDDLARVVHRPRRPPPGKALRQAPPQAGNPHRLPQQDGRGLGHQPTAVSRDSDPGTACAILHWKSAFDSWLIGP